MKQNIHGLFSFMKVTRVWNLTIIVFAQLSTAWFLVVSPNENYDLNINLLLTILSTVFIASAGYVINDYYDIKIDFINKPDRVVIGKTIKRRQALAIHILFSGIGLLLGFIVGRDIFFLNLLSVFLLWVYSNQLKRLPLVGNIIVAFLTSLSVLVIGFLFDFFEYIIFLYALFAFVYTLIREVVKDMEDIKGDMEYGCKTLPIVIGLRSTKLFLYSIVVIFTITSFFIVQIEYFYWQVLITVLAALNIYFIIALIRADKIEQFKNLSNFTKFIMLIGIISMIFVG